MYTGCTKGNKKFPDMKRLANKLTEKARAPASGYVFF